AKSRKSTCSWLDDAVACGGADASSCGLLARWDGSTRAMTPSPTSSTMEVCNALDHHHGPTLRSVRGGRQGRRRVSPQRLCVCCRDPCVHDLLPSLRCAIRGQGTRRAPSCLRSAGAALPVPPMSIHGRGSACRRLRPCAGRVG